MGDGSGEDSKEILSSMDVAAGQVMWPRPR